MSAHASRPTTSLIHNLEISDIAVNTWKSIASVDVLVNKERRDAQWERTDNQTLRATFNPPLEISPSCQFTLRLHFRRDLLSLSSWTAGNITIDVQELINAISDRGTGRREWRRSSRGTEIVVGLLPERQGRSHDEDANLPSVTDEIIEICPRFRILVIGKSGVGKSSLINRAFGVNKANVSDINAGKSDINTEIFSADNNRFVLHDSQGFEHGEVRNVEIVQEFIERRSKMPAIKDKLHAIWLCFEIPRAGGRILETGVEDFLRLKTSGQLGQIPVIAIFTKYDQLIPRVKRTMDASLHARLTPQGLLEFAKHEADGIVQKECIGPFEDVVRKEVPHITVSVDKGYEDTLSNLIKLTYDHVREHVAREASIVSAIAQKVNPGVNIDASIEVGKIRYWKGLATSVSFPGKTLERCLNVIHCDIVAVWTFEDPRKLLLSREFKALMTNMIDELNNETTSNPNRGLSVGLSMVGTIAGIVSGLAGPAAPIVIPIAGCFVLAKWAYDVYQQSHGTLRRLMAYIIDLTLIMQNLFWFVAIYRVPVSRRLVKFAFKTYRESDVRSQVHFAIEEFVKGASVIDRMHRDAALGQIVELINRYRIDTAEMFDLKDQIGAFDISATDDEPWYV